MRGGARLADGEERDALVLHYNATQSAQSSARVAESDVASSSISSSMLTLLLREIESNATASALSSALPLLRRRSLVAGADPAIIDAWSARLLQLLSGGSSVDVRLGAADLLSETIRQCSHETFTKHREQWTSTLLHWLQPPAGVFSSLTQKWKSGDDENNDLQATLAAADVRLAVADALLKMVAVASQWPAERRDLQPAVARLASNLVAMLKEPACRQGAVGGLSALCLSQGHALRGHKDRLLEALPPIILDAPFPQANAAIHLLSTLPSCLPHASQENAWLLVVKQLGGTMVAALAEVFGSVSNRKPHTYELPSHPLPRDALYTDPNKDAAASGGGSSAALDAALGTVSRRDALLRVMNRCALALHQCFTPSTAWLRNMSTTGHGGSSSSSSHSAVRHSGLNGEYQCGFLPVPIQMIVDLATHCLSTDGALAQRNPPATCLPYPELLLILSDVHVVGLQLLYSLLIVAKRHCLGYAHPIVDLLKRTWQLSGVNGPPHLRDRNLRAAAYSLAKTLVNTLGPVSCPILVEPLAHAAFSDFAPPPKPPTEAELAAESEAAKRQRQADQIAAAYDVGPDGKHDALDALHALLLNGTELIPMAILSQIQNLLLAVTSNLGATEHGIVAAPEAWAKGLEALHAAVGTGRASHDGVLPHALQIFRMHSTGPRDQKVKQAAMTALHALDALIHPAGVTIWGTPVGHETVANHAMDTSGMGAGMGASSGARGEFGSSSSSFPSQPSTGRGGIADLIASGNVTQLPTEGTSFAAHYEVTAKPSEAAVAEAREAAMREIALPAQPQSSQAQAGQSQAPEPPRAPPPPGFTPVPPPPIPLPSVPLPAMAAPAPAPAPPPPIPAAAAAPPPPPPPPPKPPPPAIPASMARAAATALQQQQADGSDSDVEIVDVGPDEADKARLKVWP